MKITKRETIFSVVIVAAMLILGIVLSDKINDSLMNSYQEYNTTLQINDDSELFEYGMRTNIGNAFVHGNLAAVGSVSYPEVEGQYATMTKVTERYTMHTRTVTKTRTVNGKTQTYTTTEHYWTWDTIDRDYIHEGTIYTVLSDNTISNTTFYCNRSIEETIDSLEVKWQLIVFWVFWILLISGLVYGFYYIDNRWLENQEDIC